MSKFIVRVELHGASETVYALLHKKMADAGYYRQILADDGAYYHLPTATYTQNFTQDFTAYQVRDHVKPILDSIWTVSAVLATKYSEAAWTGLPVAASKAA